jgi:hypothetical protein
VIKTLPPGIGRVPKTCVEEPGILKPAGFVEGPGILKPSGMVRRTRVEVPGRLKPSSSGGVVTNLRMVRQMSFCVWVSWKGNKNAGLMKAVRIMVHFALDQNEKGTS